MKTCDMHFVQHANTVKKKKYNIDANRLTTKGMGATNKLSRQVEFNRVATFKAE